MQLFFFARFHVRRGSERAAEELLRAVLGPSREEPGCLSINALRSIKDPLLFIIHSRWADEAAFEFHAQLPHTVHFVQQLEPLLDQEAEFTRAELIG